MFRQSPARNQRSKGSKVKHALQVCFLIAVCFWLIYQVKHLHDKKKEHNEYDGDSGLSTEIASDSDFQNLGRKDLKPKLDETLVTKEETNKEADETAAEEEKNKHEEEEEAEEDPKTENKHEEEEAEEDPKTEKKDEESGGGEDEMDHDEDEKSDAEVDKEDTMDEDEVHVQENSEVIARDSNGPLEKENFSADQDIEDETDESTHEAREENYKADDVSSAVSHGSQIISDEDAFGKSNNFSRSKNLKRVMDTNIGGVHNAVLLMEDKGGAENLDTTSNDAVKNLAAGSEDIHLENIAEGAMFADVSGLSTVDGVNQGNKPGFSSSISGAGLDTET